MGTRVIAALFPERPSLCDLALGLAAVSEYREDLFPALNNIEQPLQTVDEIGVQSTRRAMQQLGPGIRPAQHGRPGHRPGHVAQISLGFSDKPGAMPALCHGNGTES